MMNDDMTATNPAATSRRGWMVGAVAAGAALAGAGLAWWRQRPAAAEAGVVDRLWTLNFNTPQGGSLALSSFRGRPLLLNFWATWCPPCVEEMPLLDRFYRQQPATGWQVLGLAIDQPSSVRTFLQRLPVSFPIGLAGLEGTELTKALGNQSGGLPFTAVIGADGQMRERRMGLISEADLRSWSARN
jgi:thiol-disulfide isomerase/thioredoxin